MPKLVSALFVFVIGLSAALLLSGFTSNTISDLPPRPTAVPPVATNPAPNGSQIQLHLENEEDEIPANLWTVIEWQDPNTDNWHIVEGWRGTLDAPTSQTWWVGSDLFGTGPFRWQLYTSEDGILLATSESFNLPTHAREMLVINVMLESGSSDQ